MTFKIVKYILNILEINKKNMKLLPKELKEEALQHLLLNIPRWQIPKWKIYDEEGYLTEIELDDWEGYGQFDTFGNYYLPEYFDYDNNENEYIPVGKELIFDTQIIFSTALDIAAEDYPSLYNELIQ